LHWASAVLILLAFLGALRAVFFEPMCCGGEKRYFFLLHAYAGIAVLMLAFARIVWRFFKPWPKAESPSLISRFVSLAHILIYVLVILVPLNGWITVSAAGCCLSVPGLGSITELDLIEAHRPSGADAYELHVTLAWTLAALLVVHVIAALVHHFLLKDQSLSNMLPGRKWQKPSARDGTKYSSTKNKVK
jgi:cytochrome b561